MNVTSLEPHIYLFRKTSTREPVYVGQSGGGRYYVTGGDILLNKLKELGKEEFWQTYSKEIIKTTKVHRLNIVETLYIAHFDTYHNGYNKVELGGTTRGLFVTQETRDKISKANRGRKCTEEHKKNVSLSKLGSKNAFFGKSHSVESRRKISLNQSGINNSRFKVPHTEEAKLKMSIANKLRLKIQCPYCNLYTTKTNSIRWHFDNCKQKPL